MASVIPRVCLLVLFLVVMLPESEAFFNWKKIKAFFRKKSVDSEPKAKKPTQHDAFIWLKKSNLGLVGDAGHYLWTHIESSKLYIWAFTGYSLDEKLTVYFVSILCNVLYCCLVLIGFYFLPRDFMLVVGLLTCTVGPSLVLFVLGLIGLSVALMAFYPMHTVAIIWIFNFARSQFMQRLGLMLKLDIDGDGSVNWSDAIAWIGNTSWGAKLGFRKLHDQICSSRSQTLVEFFNQCIARHEENMVNHLEKMFCIHAIVPVTPHDSIEDGDSASTDSSRKFNQQFSKALEHSGSDWPQFSGMCEEQPHPPSTPCMAPAGARPPSGGALSGTSPIIRHALQLRSGGVLRLRRRGPTPLTQPGCIASSASIPAAVSDSRWQGAAAAGPIRPVCCNAVRKSPAAAAQPAVTDGDETGQGGGGGAADGANGRHWTGATPALKPTAAALHVRVAHGSWADPGPGWDEGRVGR